MLNLRRRASAAKRRTILVSGATVAWVLRRRRRSLRPGVTVLTVNWNSLPYLRAMLDATRAMSGPDVEIVVVDNGSRDGSVEYLRGRSDVRVVRLPINVGHGVALDIGAALVETEHLAVLDVDAFPISPRWLEESLAALEAGAKVAGARLHRNFVHPCFLVTSTALVQDLGLTFRPVGTLTWLSTRAPLFLDVGEALSQRVMVKFGGGRAIHFFEVTSTRRDGVTGAVVGSLVYHNMFATQGAGKDGALDLWREALAEHHPTLTRG